MKNKTKHSPLDRLKHHVTGAVERGEKTAIEAVVEPKHTAGPWFMIIEIRTLTNVSTGKTTQYDEYRIASKHEAITDGITKGSNADLICAAPCMLEALDLLQDHGTEIRATIGDIEWDNILNIITKAKGGAK